MVMFIVATGRKTDRTGKEPILTWTELIMKAFGSTTNIMVMARKSGLTVPFSKVTTDRVRNTAKVNSFGLTEASFEGNLSIIRWKARVSTNGSMDVATMANGKITCSTVKAISHGRTAVNTLVTT